MNAFQTHPESTQRKPCPRWTSLGLALLVGAWTALAPISAQTAQDTPKKHKVSSEQSAKAKPQQRRPSQTAKAKSNRSAPTKVVTGTPLESSAQTQAWTQDAAQRPFRASSKWGG